MSDITATSPDVSVEALAARLEALEAHEGHDCQAPAAVPTDTTATTAPVTDSVGENIDARQAIRQDFVDIAKDGKGVGSDKKERQVDQMLYDMLPKIDFSKPGGAAYADEIGNFVKSMGHNISKGEIQHLKGLLEEAAATVPADAPGATAPGGEPGTNGTNGTSGSGGTGGTSGDSSTGSKDDELLKTLLALLTKLIAGDGNLSEADRKELLQQLAGLVDQMASKDAPAGGESSGTAPAGENGGTSGGESAQSGSGTAAPSGESSTAAPAPAPEATPAPAPQPSSEEQNIAARQDIRETFVDVAKDGRGGVGSDANERKVDKLLADYLPQIDFSQAGGDAYKTEISNFLRTMGRNFSDGEIQHLEGLLKEAQATLQPDEAIAQPAPAGGDAGSTSKTGQPDGTADSQGADGAGSTAKADDSASSNDKLLTGILKLLLDLLQGQEDGKLDDGEKNKLLTDVASLLQNLVGDEGATPAATTGGTSTSDDSSTGATSNDSTAVARPSNQMHDSVWFLEQTGLSTFLKGYFNDGSNRNMTNLVINTLRNSENFVSNT